MCKFLLFTIFCHTFYCVQGNRNRSKCRCYTRSFVDDVDISLHLDFKVRFGISEFKDTQLESFIETLKGHIYLLNLYYVVSDFNQHFYRPNANFGVISFEAINKPFMPYLIYLGVFLKVFLTTWKLSATIWSTHTFLSLKHFQKILQQLKK